MFERSGRDLNCSPASVSNGMSSIALGVWVAFLKLSALPGKATQTKKNSKKIQNH
jgi:hypothetical protein